MEDLKASIERSFDGGEIDTAAVYAAIAALDTGVLRVADKHGDAWRVHGWVQKAILLYFRVQPMRRGTQGDYPYYDKIPLKTELAEQRVRVVAGGIVRYGAFLEPGCVVMPALVNIGAYVGANTMVDTWATVGSGAQIGSGVHLSGGVGIGGVLEPPSSRPVIVEDDVFVGSRCVLVEGMYVERGAVLGAGCVLTASTPIIDVTGAAEVVYKGRVPARSVCIPGTRKKSFPSGEYQVPCVLIVGQRSASTDEKTSLNDALREHGLG